MSERRLVNIGHSYYISLPRSIIPREWLESRSVKVTVIYADERKLVVRIESGEHGEDNADGGENT